jgi:hypothetical protein
MVLALITPIGVLSTATGERTFAVSTPIRMSTTGKRFAKRTSDKLINRVLDARAKTLLSAVLAERPGKALSAYLRSGFVDRNATDRA